MVLGETKAYSEDESVETLREETSGALLVTSSPIPFRVKGFNWLSFFKREQSNVKQSDIVIVCVFHMHYLVSTLMPSTSALLDQLG